MSSVFVSFRHGQSSGLHDECREVVNDCYRWIIEDGKSVPNHQHEWRIGHTFSWHYVKIVEYRAAQLIQTLETFHMAAKGKKNAGNERFEGYRFVKCEMLETDKKTAKIWIEENATQFGPLLHDVMASDYKLSVSFSSEHDTFTACLVGKTDNVFNSQKTLTARHKDWVFAAMTVLYKHLVIFKGTIWEDTMSSEDDGWA